MAAFGILDVLQQVQNGTINVARPSTGTPKAYVYTDIKKLCNY